MLIPGKSHSRDESRNSRVSIETLDFARVRTFTCMIGVGSLAGREGGRGDHQPDPAPFPADYGTPSPPADINIAVSGYVGYAPKTAGVRVWGSATGEAQWPSATERQAGKSPPPPV